MIRKMLIYSCCMAFLTLCACNAPAEPAKTDTDTDLSLSFLIEEEFVDAIGQLNSGESAYLVYNCACREFHVFTEFEYEMGYAFAHVVANKENSIWKIPPGQGWKEAGRGNSELDALLIAKNLAGKLPKEHNFEIRVEYQPDGSFIVWYRLI